ncbi:hypothetical protein F7725_026530 [Dissostichus mawsoni]|uniref:Uncharacterized protein n=1 Tax=Dissostichus mawsoni TaxID=36200 RepID=A0A7J5X7B7_DISMA|nr:hypothetical protein F7725_026530 [Dissostichus mawsoni]
MVQQDDEMAQTLQQSGLNIKQVHTHISSYSPNTPVCHNMHNLPYDEQNRMVGGSLASRTVLQAASGRHHSSQENVSLGKWQERLILAKEQDDMNVMTFWDQMFVLRGWENS